MCVGGREIEGDRERWRGIGRDERERDMETDREKVSMSGFQLQV